MRIALTVAAMLAVVLSGPTSAHVGDRAFPIFEVPTSDLPVLHDRTLADGRTPYRMPRWAVPI